MPNYAIIHRQARFGDSAEVARLWRYFIYCQLGPGSKMIGWLLHNPSTADETTDDPTSHRVLDFSWRWGFDHMFLMNPWAGVATHKDDLWRMADPVGPENDEIIAKLATMIRDSGGYVVLGYGVLPKGACPRVDHVRKILTNIGVTLMCLTRTHQGFPSHPLYIETECTPKPWTEPVFPPFSPPRPAPLALNASSSTPVRRSAVEAPRPVAQVRPVIALALPPEIESSPAVDDGLPKRRVRK